ncbi:MAG: hypothetical protein F6K50_34985 [Moorea sp. SIO3I7]|nr:hypothetical protein [Moorena sp. SIO3I7]
MKENCFAYFQQIATQDWDRTPTSVKKLVEQMGQRIEQLEQETAQLRITMQQHEEKINRTSKNSSSPPSQDPPNIPRAAAKKEKW